MKEHRYLPLNLQFFADGGGDGDQTPPNQSGGQEQTQTGTGDQNPPEEKTFTQEDVNNLIARETKKQQEKLLKELGISDFENAKDGLTKFRDWQESQKTEQEKQQELLQTLNKEKETLAGENSSLKAQLSALKQGVKGVSVEDVVALAERLVTDEISIDDAIKQVVEKYPHFKDQQEQHEERKPTFTTGQHQKGEVNNDPFLAKLAKYKQ